MGELRLIHILAEDRRSIHNVWLGLGEKYELFHEALVVFNIYWIRLSFRPEAGQRGKWDRRGGKVHCMMPIQQVSHIGSLMKENSCGCLKNFHA